MCGRYENAADDRELQEEFEKYIGNLNIAYDLDEVLKTENIAPTDNVKIIVLEDNVFKLKTIKWGIKDKVYDIKRKQAGKDPFIQKDIFNSRIETINKSGSLWKKYFRESRCLFPMTAFYEWPVSMNKKPQRIFIENEKIFFAGGIRAVGTDTKNSASIITSVPNEFIKTIHNRMPVLFNAEKAAEFMKAGEDVAAAMCEPLDDDVIMKLEPAILK